MSAPDSLPVGKTFVDWDDTTSLDPWGEDRVVSAASVYWHAPPGTYHRCLWSVELALRTPHIECVECLTSGEAVRRYTIPTDRDGGADAEQIERFAAALTTVPAEDAPEDEHDHTAFERMRCGAIAREITEHFDKLAAKLTEYRKNEPDALRSGPVRQAFSSGADTLRCLLDEVEREL